MSLTFDEVAALIAYDPETGSLRWKVACSRRVKRGREVGNLTPHGYRETRVLGVKCFTHRLAWLLHYGEWPAGYIDHINGEKTDNRICNLRIATKSLNGANRGKPTTNTSGFKGVSWDKRAQKWQATITKNWKRHFLGFYSTPEEAHKAYIAGAEVMFGAYARSE